MKNLLRFLAALCPLLTAQPVLAQLHVFACEPEWAALATTLGGDRVSVFAATTGLQDPHQIQARPSLIARLRRADLVICTGAQLEIGWMPMLLRQAGNGRIQPGSAGYLSATDAVTLLEVPERVDRALGDIHPAGNPHIQTDPRNIARVAAVLETRLETLDPAEAASYRRRYEDFQTRWQAAIRRWEAEAAPLRGVAVALQHDGWAYLARWLDLRVVATLEPKPGVPPSTTHLARVLESLRQHPARMVIYAAYQDPRPSQWLAHRAQIPAVMLPFTVGGTGAAADLFGLFDDTVARLREAMR